MINFFKQFSYNCVSFKSYRKFVMYRLALLTFVLLKTLFMLFVIVYGEIGLSPDEAQYWTWSQQLDWGYYSKPPGIAVEILFGTLFFGNTELGVRTGALLIGFLLPFAVWHLAKRSGLDEKGAFMAGLIMNFAPIGLIASLLATTDGPFILFWTLGCTVIVDALFKEKSPNYLLFGFFIFLGALFKWPIYYLWVVALIVACWQREFKTSSFLGGVAVSLLGLVPSLIWNSNRGWPTFLHVWTTMIGRQKFEAANPPLLKGNFWDFIGAQAALLSPILFILLIIALVSLWKQRKVAPKPILFCGALSVIALTTYSLAAFAMKMQGNWCVFAYPTAIVVLAWWCTNGSSWRWIWTTIGIVLSIVFCMISLAVPTMQATNLDVGIKISYSVNPFRECLGWRKLTPILDGIEKEMNPHFLFADTYQMSSLLSFYNPSQQRAYFINLGKVRRNQFSYWKSMADEQLKNNGLYIKLVQNPLKINLSDSIAKNQEKLKPYFDHVEFIGFYTLFSAYEVPAKGVLIYQCNDYNGKEPPKLEVY